MQETLTVVRLLHEGKSWETIQKAVMEDDLFEQSNRTTRKNSFREIRRRLKNIPEAWWAEMLDASLDNKKIMNYLIVLQDNRLIREFMLEVVREKMLTLQQGVTRQDVRGFMERKRLESEEVRGWTESTIVRTSRNLLMMAVSAGVLEKSGDEHRITPPYISENIRNLLLKHHMRPLLLAVLDRSEA
ncbi:membrane protein [Deinococcus cellulosilyticus NBRC 106333 = KACC 11606]|uniref:Membrane protein n=2 Tax=Deinococcus cellulosilyticus TaxID=401558 RepID=A0A511N9H2_DEIC1|nr:membrane protein [Deinococcus cellulosilyticus NBRC 106333 = KACC 11606]